MIRGSILADVQSGSQTKLTTSKSVVILGKFCMVNLSKILSFYGYSFL